MQDDTLLTRNMCMPIRAGVEKNMWSKNKERAQNSMVLESRRALFLSSNP